jgi:predicted CoA-substrate-specific enzyme activase
MISAGIDIGSTTTKAVILDESIILSEIVIPSGGLPGDSARRAFELSLEKSGINREKIEAVAMTGYGRRMADFGDMIVTEIKACGYGAYFASPSHNKFRTVIDVGGQDTKVISLTDDGEVEDFSMNDKCAAGTGRFLEMLSHKLDLSYEDFVRAALESGTIVHMNSTCAVFAESEVISLLAKGVSRNDIAASAHYAIAERIGSMIRRIGQKTPVCFAGGGAKNTMLVRTVAENLNEELIIPDSPQTIVALGAAIAAQKRIISKENKS